MSLSTACVLLPLSIGFLQDIRGISSMELRSDVSLRGFADCPQFPLTVYNGEGPFTGLSVGTGGCGADVCEFSVNGGSGGSVSQAFTTRWRLAVEGLGVDYTPGATARIRLHDPDGGPNGVWMGQSSWLPGDVSFHQIGTNWFTDPGEIELYNWKYNAPYPLPYATDFLASISDFNQGNDFDFFTVFDLISLDGSAPPQVVFASVEGNWDYSGPSISFSPYETAAEAFDPRALPCTGTVGVSTWVTGDGARYQGPLASDPASGSEAILKLDGYLSPSGFEQCTWEDILQISTAIVALESPVELTSLEATGGTLRINGATVSPALFPVTLPTGTHTLHWSPTADSGGSAIIRIRAFDTPFAMRDCLGAGEPDACAILAGEADDIDRNWLPDSCQRALGDLTLNGVIDSGDLAVILSAWSTADSDADLNDDGIVAASDIMELLNRWGPLE